MLCCGSRENWRVKPVPEPPVSGTDEALHQVLPVLAEDLDAATPAVSHVDQAVLGAGHAVQRGVLKRWVVRVDRVFVGIVVVPASYRRRPQWRLYWPVAASYTTTRRLSYPSAMKISFVWGST